MSSVPQVARSRYHARVAVLSSEGVHLRYIPGGCAQALVEAGALFPQAGRGRISVAYVAQSAAHHATRIGEPEGRPVGTRFYRWVHLEGSTSRIFEHHPRCFY